MSDHVYRLRYTLDMEPGSFSAEEIRAKSTKTGGTDALLVISLLYPADGSFSQNTLSFDGRNGGKRLPPQEVFKAWLMLAGALARDEALDEGRRAFANDVFQAFMEMQRGSVRPPGLPS